MIKISSILFVLFSSHFCFGTSIKGKIHDFTIGSKINISYLDVINQNIFIVASSIVENKGMFEISINIDKPGLFQINNNIYVFITPDDNITIEIKGNKIVNAIGKNSGNYLFFSTFSYNSLVSEIVINSENAIYMAKSIINEQLDGFKNLDRNNVSKQFITYLNNDIKCRYFSLFFVQINKKKIVLNDIEKIIEFNGHVNFPNENNYRMLTNYFYYLIQNENFQLNNDFFFKTAYKFNNMGFNETDKEFLLFWLYRYGVKSEITFKSYEDFFNIISMNIRNKKYKDILNYWNSIYQKKQGFYSEEMLMVRLRDIDGNEITFQNLLEKYKGKLIFLDFWAKWCGACLSEFPDIGMLDNKINNPDFVTVGISIDNDFKDFEQICKKYNLKNSNQYFLGEKQNTIHHFFELESIPKYNLINKDSKIILFDSYRPKNEKILEIIRKNL